LDLDFLTSTSTIPLADILIRMAVAAVIGAGIGLTYHRTFRGLTYSTAFRNTNVLVTIIICAIILSIGSNIALSLGLVGSLSVIRFRAVVKDVMDMIYLFWSIGVGIACGAGQFHIALALFVFVLGVLAILVARPFRGTARNRFVIKVVYDDRADVARFEGSLKQRFRDLSLRSSFRNASSQTTEATYLVKLAEGEASSAEMLIGGSEPGVVSTQMIRFDGVTAL
jgi:uncharacterized membrane protein YhiD involved in acid resistance